MDMTAAVSKINANGDLRAREVRGSIEVSVYGKVVGNLTQDDIDSLGNSATGWGKGLRKGAMQVYRALTD